MRVAWLFLSQEMNWGPHCHQRRTQSSCSAKLPLAAWTFTWCSGGHSSVGEEPHIRDLVHQFRCCLDKAFILSKTIKKS